MPPWSLLKAPGWFGGCGNWGLLNTVIVDLCQCKFGYILIALGARVQSLGLLHFDMISPLLLRVLVIVLQVFA